MLRNIDNKFSKSKLTDLQQNNSNNNSLITKMKIKINYN